MEGSAIHTVTCSARGCCEPESAAGFCVAHGDLVYRFHMWLLNANGPPHAGGSFDAARLVWERAARARAR
jgi:hypothetical protein